ncbi:phosphatidylserine decarboxylase [Bacillus sp. V5-8f]|uniref:phosphatidylserine decarboxylase n=1 Tax=Bacillus sp. V5-8f TaxID=2053044 RepID=UPI000C77704A|nr:phosphatidylserine decarboxylase [Bacillus sp. V5-8f]PLT34622.1 phosphatidylserine decarboxylase [Bacillus sp. V5-8f]
MLQTFYRLLIELTNGRISSAALKKLTRSKWSRRLISGYAKVYKIDKEEMADDIQSFKTLHDLFTRRLKSGARMIHDDESAVVSPVDGVLEDYGDITAEKNIIVKGKEYSIAEMLGGDHCVERYTLGKYLVLYLSPSHYHRIHAPVTGKVISRRVLGNKSYPVNRLGMKYGRSTLSKNYRNITEVEHGGIHLAIVKVGAMFVNSIIITDESDVLSKGQEFAYFSFGSTVVLLFEKSSFQLAENKPIPHEVRVGEKIGYVRKK